MFADAVSQAWAPAARACETPVTGWAPQKHPPVTTVQSASTVHAATSVGGVLQS